MEEADALADHVVVLATGRVIATGTPSELKDEIRGRVVELTLANRGQEEKAAAILQADDIRPSTGESVEVLNFVLLRSGPPLLAILQRLQAGGVNVSDVIVRRPTLDEAFLHLTKKAEVIPEPETEPLRATP
jgi:ABC-2 type transport system ATP-binding protein